MVWHSKAPERCSFHGWNQPTRASTHVLRDGQSMLVTRMGVAVRRLAKERTAMHVGRAHLPGNQQIRAVNSLPPPLPLPPRPLLPCSLLAGVPYGQQQARVYFMGTAPFLPFPPPLPIHPSPLSSPSSPAALQLAGRDAVPESFQKEETSEMAKRSLHHKQPSAHASEAKVCAKANVSSMQECEQHLEQVDTLLWLTAPTTINAQCHRGGGSFGVGCCSAMLCTEVASYGVPSLLCPPPPPPPPPPPSQVHEVHAACLGCSFIQMRDGNKRQTR